MWEFAIGFYVSQMKAEAEEFTRKLRAEMRAERLALCRSVEDVDRCIARMDREDDEANAERRHREHMQAIRDAKPVIRVVKYL